MEPFYRGTHPFCVCIDSDGTVFDNMELKHKECFCPAFIHSFALQSISRYAREAWEYENLYSPSRGCSRFKAMYESIELLKTHPGVAARQFALPDVSTLKECVDLGVVSNAAFEEFCLAHPNDAIAQAALACAKEINENVARIVHNVAPLAGAVKAMKALRERCDIVIVSDAPHQNLLYEWGTQGIGELPHFICGQEYGTKEVCISTLLQSNSYAPGHVLMIGDSPWDQEAAASCGILSYPILPGREDDSWALFLAESMDRFLSGTYAGDYAEGRIAAYRGSLSPIPPWAEERS